MGWRWRVLGVMAPLALALLLISSNVRWALNSVSLHTALFDRHNVSEPTGIAPGDLESVGRQVETYLTTSTDEPLSVVTEVHGEERSLFSPVETEHLADVKGLFDLTFRIQEASALFLLLIVGAAAYLLRPSPWRVLGRWARRGALLTAGLVASIGLISSVAFEPLFTLFHRLGFRNDFWQLDPRTDFLVMVYPFGFWRDVTLIIGIAILAEAALLFLAVRLISRRLLARRAWGGSAETPVTEEALREGPTPGSGASG